MTNNIGDCATLQNGVKIPWLGLGTWKSKEGNEVIEAVKYALAAGYRSIDTAAVYGNEEGVGKAIEASGINLKELFITTKVWNSNQGYESTLKAFETSRKALGLDYLDLYLIHWPVKLKYKETWRALEKLYKDGLVRAIGVSNFHIHHLTDLLQSADVVPMINQVEYHPLLQQEELHAFCKKYKIQMQAWSPLMQGNLDQPIINELSKKYGKSAAQIALRWDLQNEVVTIPKSVSPKRIDENAAIFDFEIADEDMKLLKSMNKNKRFGPDPDNFNF